MNGELAQVIALATHGTSWLRTADVSAPPLDAMSSTFAFVRSVAFAVEERRGPLRRRRPTTMPDVAAWLHRLRLQHVTRLWLAIPERPGRDVDGHATDEHKLVAFAGAGAWLLLATGDKTSEIWGPSWEVGAPGAPDNRIWDVVYRGVVARDQIAPPRPPIAGARDGLRSALTEIRAFARKHRLSPWTSWFAHALDALEADAPEPPYHPDMIPAAYPPDARRLLAAATQSWVFGGMGSWNDLGFEAPDENERYDALSRQLYAAMLTAFVAAVNVEL